MHIYLNECSLHGQFSDIDSFTMAIDTLVDMRSTAKRFNIEIYCHRKCSQVKITHNLILPQAIKLINKDKARVLMGWFSKHGPYWDDRREHSPDKFIECQNQVVTDTAIGECVHLVENNVNAQLVSLSPSDWTSSTLKSKIKNDDNTIKEIEITNHINSVSLSKNLMESAPPPDSWANFSEICRTRFSNLHFTEMSFEPLQGVPFVQSAAKSFLDLLDVLSKYKGSLKENSERSETASELYNKFFTGDSPWFTDSSESEKSKFKKEMTFKNPENNKESIFATFHGKVQTPQMRVHFSWPIKANEKTYILYIGNKITKR